MAAALQIVQFDLSYSRLVSTTIWSFTFLTYLSLMFWLYEVYHGLRYEEPPREYGNDEIQVQILTIGAERIVQKSVDAIPDDIEDIHVVAERSIEIGGADVHVVPSDFECRATRKGRALEWARRNIDCEKEFVLYLDEDTCVSDIAGLPEADIVQFMEKPVQTGSIMCFLAEVLRMGYQVEQRVFSKFDLPLYVWGGGVAIRKELVDEVTWNRDTLIEDTSFAWVAATQEDIDIACTTTKFRNQAPPTIRDMIAQRRRWIAGTREAFHSVPLNYSAILGVRNLSWGLSSLTSLFLLTSVIFPSLLVSRPVLQFLLLGILGFPVLWTVLGLNTYRGDEPATRLVYLGLLLIVLNPLITVIHSLGALLGLVSIPEQFEVTSKVEKGLDDVTNNVEGD